MRYCHVVLCLFFNDTGTTEIYTYVHTLSLHDALPIYGARRQFAGLVACRPGGGVAESDTVNSGVRVVIDPDGYRPNVGIVLMHPDGRVFWARRVRCDGWQFPQGGMNTDETPLEAMYRELEEETGLRADHVAVLGVTPGWLRYRLPHRAIRRNDKLVCIGQTEEHT